MEISWSHNFFLLVQFFILYIGCLHSLSTDQSTLMALKAHINPETENILAKNWTTATSVCNWIGITCAGQPRKIIALNLSSMDLEGTIPPDIGNLSSLQVIDLSFNSFKGEIPTELGNLAMLQKLYLSRNKLEGQIPSSIGNCTLLKELNFSENNLKGTLYFSQYQPVCLGPQLQKNTPSGKRVEFSAGIG
ncbi:hypothetical protein DITRI_Ditri07aG0052600 [Diplodiscus trichospermus]